MQLESPLGTRDAIIKTSFPWGSSVSLKRKIPTLLGPKLPGAGLSARSGAGFQWMAEPGPPRVMLAQAEEKRENALRYKGVGAPGRSRKVASLESCLLHGWLRVVAPLAFSLPPS